MVTVMSILMQERQSWVCIHTGTGFYMLSVYFPLQLWVITVVRLIFLIKKRPAE